MNRKARWLLVGVGIVVGIAFTWGTASFGLRMASGPTCRRPQVATARLRVKAAREAVAQYMIATSRCPRGVDELVLEKVLDEAGAKDPWGSALILSCPGVHADGAADVWSLGPDKRLGTPDDIKSWEL